MPTESASGTSPASWLPSNAGLRATTRLWCPRSSSSAASSMAASSAPRRWLRVTTWTMRIEPVRARGPEPRGDAMPGRYWRPWAGRDGRPPPRQGLPSTTVRGAIFVVAGSPTGQQGPVASLLSTAGWASGAAEVLGPLLGGHPGRCHVGRRRHGTAGPHPALRSPDGTPLRRAVPAPLKTAVKDARQWRRRNHFGIDPSGPWTAPTSPSCGSATSCSSKPGSASPASSRCPPCCSYRPRSSGRPSSGASVAPGGAAGSRRSGSRRPCDRPTSWPAALPRSLSRRVASVSGGPPRGHVEWR